MKERNYYQNMNFALSKVHIRKKGKVYEFEVKGKVEVMYFLNLLQRSKLVQR